MPSGAGARPLAAWIAARKKATIRLAASLDKNKRIGFEEIPFPGLVCCLWQINPSLETLPASA
jgi:hypothetical protein